MDFATHAEEAAETHDQWTPLFGVDVQARTVAHQKRFIDVQLDDVNFKEVGGDIFAKRAPVMNDAFHLHEAFRDAGRQDFERRRGCESGSAELVRLVTITPAEFFLGHGVPASGERKAIHMRDLILGRKIDDALARANQVF